MEWINVEDELPVVPKGRKSVSVLCSVHDPIYEEVNPTHGSETQNALWDGRIFKALGVGGNGQRYYYQIPDIVTHWMYFPKAVQSDVYDFKTQERG